MRGTRVKALRTADRPNPGRKHGGATKTAVRELATPRFRAGRVTRRFFNRKNRVRGDRG